jgi:hypothetical protein
VTALSVRNGKSSKLNTALLSGSTTVVRIARTAGITIEIEVGRGRRRRRAMVLADVVTDDEINLVAKLEVGAGTNNLTPRG